MKKFCIFCGEKPSSKTKEHIIPQWLINLTGDPNRNINLGIDFKALQLKNDFKLKTYSFKAFHFPACASCNQEFSDLENRVKSHVMKILNSDFLVNTEIDELLDWLDKVRVGLWLGSILLDGQVENVNPKFYIKNRISHRDRCLHVYEMEKSNEKGIQFIGSQCPLFQYTPSCFALRINNLYFFNLSFDFLFSKNIGFPYPREFAFSNEKGRLTQVEIELGTGKPRLPLVNMKFLKPSISIYQPIIPIEIFGSSYEEFYTENQYVHECSLDFQKRKGSIFYIDKGLHILEDETELCLTDGEIIYDSDKFPNRMAVQVFDTLEYLTKAAPSDELLPFEDREKLKKNQQSLLAAHRIYKKMGGLTKSK